jgi:hypothetical protein
MSMKRGDFMHLFSFFVSDNDKEVALSDGTVTLVVTSSRASENTSAATLDEGITLDCLGGDTFCVIRIKDGLVVRSNANRKKFGELRQSHEDGLL